MIGGRPAMNDGNKPKCDNILIEAWSCWPEIQALPPFIAEHLLTCSSCRTELQALQNLCHRSTTQEGTTLRWSEMISTSHWMLLAASTQRALSPRSSLLRPAVYVPALGLGLAVASALLLWEPSPEKEMTAPLQVPVAAIEKMEMMENLDVLENWDLLQHIMPDNGKSP